MKTIRYPSLAGYCGSKVHHGDSLNRAAGTGRDSGIEAAGNSGDGNRFTRIEAVDQGFCRFPCSWPLPWLRASISSTAAVIADPDIWWHLRNAEVLVQTHSVVQQDFYSFTATGSRWINEAWLSELPYYFGWRWLGIRGVYLVMLIQTELILLGVFALACLTSGNVKASFLASSLAVCLATVSFGPRTLLAGWICLVAELFLLEQFRKGKDWSWWLVPLFILWANLHGSWLIGIVLFAVFCACGLVSGDWGRIEATRWTGRATAQADVRRRTERRRALPKSLHLPSGLLSLQFCLPAKAQCRTC